MIVVKRGKEPNSLLEFRKKNLDADYEDMPSSVRADVERTKTSLCILYEENRQPQCCKNRTLSAEASEG